MSLMGTSEATAGLIRLIRLILRRDRLRLPTWIGGVVALMVVSGATLPGLYDSPDKIRSYAEVAGDNPALVVFAGPGYGFDDPDIGVVLVNETLLWGTIATALMSIFTVIRHTRAEEESERTELLRSSVVGRHASLAAALLVVAAMNLIVAAISAAAFVAQGYAVGGSIAIATAIGAAGLVFAGVGAVAGQLSRHARGALGLATATLGVTFAVRAVGDIADNGLSWLSPLGWAHISRPFAGERWWTFLLSIGLTAVLTWTAFDLSTRRDVGRGLLGERAGPATAAPWIVPPAGLALRLQRGAIIGWSIGLLTTGLLLGAVGNDVERMVEDNPELAAYLAQLGGASITDAYFATSLQMMAMLTGGFALSSVLRARTEELAGRTESIIATPTSRTTWWFGQVVVSVLGAALMTVLGGLGAGVAYALVVDDSSQILRLGAASLVTLPAILVMVGVALVLYGFLPRLVLVNWAVFAAIVVIAIFAETLRLPQWVRNVSPFEHLPDAPARELQAAPVVTLTTVAVVLAVVGWAGFRRRDLATT
jgi:ABC-2 type transport system permease protein